VHSLDAIVALKARTKPGLTTAAVVPTVSSVTTLQLCNFAGVGILATAADSGNRVK
jgi:hypothetical protein